MEIIINKYIPAKGFKAMTIWPFIFVREDCILRYTTTDDRHEEIHGRQQLEVLLVALVLASALLFLGCGWWSLLMLPLYFAWYGIEYLIRILLYRNTKAAYRNISFEQEAYLFQDDYDYIRNRKAFAWLKYVFKKSFITTKR